MAEDTCSTCDPPSQPHLPQEKSRSTRVHPGQQRRFPREEVLPEAAGLASSLHDAGYPREEVVGSLRRGSPDVGDAEVLVAAPDIEEATRVGTVLLENGFKRGEKWGPRAYMAVAPDGTPFDVYVVVPPAQWGVLEMQRTGSAPFAAGVFTRLHRYGLASKEGQLWHEGRLVPTPTEADVFREAHMPDLPPYRRTLDLHGTRVAVWGKGEHTLEQVMAPKEGAREAAQDAAAEVRRRAVEAER